MEDLRVSIVQTDLHWENPAANLEMYNDKLKSLAGKTDLIVLPEMFATGFSMKPEAFAEKPEDSKAVKWLMKTSSDLQCCITGSLIIQENEKYFNRLFWVDKGTVVGSYDKRHLFTLAGEEKHYSAGNHHLMVELKGWKVLPLICYDLRFPVWSRNTIDYDLVIYVANWPERRSYPWSQLLRARAIENMAYVVGLNRVGYDGNEVFHSGDSAVINAVGEVVLEFEKGAETTSTQELSIEHLRQTRKKFGFLNDRDSFTIHR
ncbi:MAG TPA: amidohydrolase [Flavobacteriales bacterium]|nr:amidohydrolase [Flavobacteriales bacterium]